MTAARIPCAKCGCYLRPRYDDCIHVPDLDGPDGEFWECRDCAEADTGESLETLLAEQFQQVSTEENHNCTTCLDGSVVNDTCDDCETRHCPKCDPCGMTAQDWEDNYPLGPGDASGDFGGGQ